MSSGQVQPYLYFFPVIFTSFLFCFYSTLITVKSTYITAPRFDSVFFVWGKIFAVVGRTRRIMAAAISNPSTLKHGLSLWCPQMRSGSLNRINRSSFAVSRSFQRSFIVASSSSYANENRE